MKYGDIVVYKNKIGTVVTSKDEFKFLPCNKGCCYFDTLDTITDDIVREATHEEKLDLIKNEYVWGPILNIYCIGEYQIVEYIDKKSNKVLYHGYINYRDTNTGYCSLDTALIGCIGIKYEGSNGKAAMYFSRMVGIE